MQIQQAIQLRHYALNGFSSIMIITQKDWLNKRDGVAERDGDEKRRERRLVMCQ